jgi:anti-anti-sigma regulatory factor/HPt (histidine-containing phosphotransfer) domain-containing protein
VQISKDESGRVLKIQGALDIDIVEELRQALGDWISEKPNLMFDLSGVEACDTAALQLLSSARRTADCSNKPLQFGDLPPRDRGYQRDSWPLDGRANRAARPNGGRCRWHLTRLKPLQECEELLAEIEQSALLLASSEQSAAGESAAGESEDTINQLFRGFHTIKGSGGMCGFEGVVGFAHHVETLLDRAREGAIGASPALADLILQAKDHIKILLCAEQGGAAAPAGSTETLVAHIQEFADADPAADEKRTLSKELPRSRGRVPR